MARSKAPAKPKRVLKERPYGSGKLTESGYWSFIRSGLRAKWQRWWPRYEALKNARRKYAGPNTKQKWEFQCADCRDYFLQRQVQVDHVVPCGTLRSYADIAGFVQRLFVEVAGLRVLCKPCHAVRTKEEREKP